MSENALFPDLSVSCRERETDRRTGGREGGGRESEEREGERGGEMGCWICGQE